MAEWAVVYWSPDRQERRFKTKSEAMRFMIMLSPHMKIFVDEVYPGEEVVVR
jgi:hypothetical protein